MPNPQPAETINLHPETLLRLSKVSTATVATLLYKRGYHNAYVQGVAPLGQGKPPLVGPAFTLRYIPARPDTDPIEAFRQADHPQRVAVQRDLPRIQEDHVGAFGIRVLPQQATLLVPHIESIVVAEHSLLQGPRPCRGCDKD